MKDLQQLIKNWKQEAEGVERKYANGEMTNREIGDYLRLCKCIAEAELLLFDIQPNSTPQPPLPQAAVSGSLPLTEVFAAIQEVRQHYDVRFFPEDGISQDCLAAKMARITCDNIMHRVQMRYNAGGNDR